MLMAQYFQKSFAFHSSIGMARMVYIELLISYDFTADDGAALTLMTVTYSYASCWQKESCEHGDELHRRAVPSGSFSYLYRSLSNLFGIPGHGNVVLAIPLCIHGEYLQGSMRLVDASSRSDNILFASPLSCKTFIIPLSTTNSSPYFCWLVSYPPSSCFLLPSRRVAL